MKNLLLLFACILLPAAVGFGQSVKMTKRDAKGDLRAIYVRFLDASRLRDQAALGELMTDDYTQVVEDGRIRTKAIRIQETMDPSGTVDVLDLKEFSVRLYGDAAVAVCNVWEQYTYQGKPKSNDIYSTVTFIKQKGKWRIAATHVSIKTSKKAGGEDEE